MVLLVFLRANEFVITLTYIWYLFMRKFILLFALALLPIIASAQLVEPMFTDYVDDITVNGISLVLENGNPESSMPDTYYCPLPASVYSDQNHNFTAKVEVVFKSEVTDYDSFEFAGQEPDAEGNVQINGINLEEGSQYTITLKNSAIESDGAEVYANLNFTFLPVVEMTVDIDLVNSDKYTLGSMRVVDPDYAQYEEAVNANEEIYARFKYRGNYSLTYDKKNFAVKTCDVNEKGVDRSFFGFRNDNNWIIEACSADPTVMRNRVSTDLWNDFSTDPYYVRSGEESADEVHSGTRGRFVEVILNGSYHGLYTFTEKTDRKQLKLKKLKDDVAIRGLLYKSGSYGIEGLMGYDKSNDTFGNAAQEYDNYNKEEVWAGYEIKYPDYEEEPIDWEPLYNAINFVSLSSDEEFAKQVEEYFDRPVLDDYYLLLEIIKAYDNVGNNVFYYIYNIQDSKLMGIAPWDLDCTFGNGAAEMQDPEESLKHLLEENTQNKYVLFYRMDRRTDISWHEELGVRYRELRNTVFSTESLKNRFTDYFDLISASRADVREEKKWPQYHSDISGNVDYVCNFIDSRMAFLDEYYAEVSSSVSETESVEACKVVGSKGRIYVYSQEEKTVSVFNIGGNKVGTIDVVDGGASLVGIAPGIYIVDGQKVVVF